MAFVALKRCAWLGIAVIMGILSVLAVIDILFLRHYGVLERFMRLVAFILLGLPMTYWVGVGALRRAYPPERDA